MQFIKTLVIFIKLLGAVAFIGIGFALLGWYMLVPIGLGALWFVAQEMAKKSPTA